MKKESTTTNENAQLRLALKKANKEIQQMAKKLEQSNIKNDQLSKELKKNDVRKVVLTKEQEQLLLNLSKDMNTPNLLSD
jgi:hypothetical protein